MMVRALIFRKRFAQIEHRCNWWALIGHPDELECTEMRAMTLEEIKEVNDNLYKQDSEDSYHHAVFLINNGDTSKDLWDDQLFWDTGNNFVSITRVHFPETVGLRKQFDDLTQYFASLSSESEYSQVYWRAYYTMELSDMVLISKSCSLQALSRWSLLVTKTKLVGSAYTYFCIPGSLIEEDSRLWPEKLQEDHIDFMAIRFSVQGGNVDEALSNVRMYLGEKFTTPVFRVAGNEDAIICGQNVPVANLIRLYQSWYTSNSNILTIFRDIITRLGAGWEVTPPPLEAACYQKQETKLEKCSKAVLRKVQDRILNNDDLQNKEWLRPLVTLTNALVHMSQSATLDEPVFLILPSLNAFWDNILDEANSGTDERMYHRFAELCIHTMEHIMRAEGQLSHRPEMRPLTFDMPVFVLEYATAFLHTLSKTLTEADGSAAEQIRFLLVPSTGTAVSTEELFVATENTPGLLQTTVPFSLLYKPKYLLPSLCHEMAHYVGEKIRGREVRYWCFLRSTSRELIRYFFNKVSDESNQFQEFLVQEFLDKSLQKWVADNTPYCGSDVMKLPLSDIVSLINIIVKKWVNDDEPDAYADLIRRYVQSNYRGAQLYSIPQLALEDHRTPFADRLDDLMAYYREAYADLCLLYLLKLSPLNYLKVAVHRWDVLNTGMLLQAYVCLKVSGHSLLEIVSAIETWGENEGIAGEKRDWAYMQITSINDLLCSGTVCAEKYLMEYLQYCWNTFEEKGLDIKTDDTKDTVKDIYEKILNISNGTKYPDILSVIDDGRQSTLDDLSLSLT